MEHAEAVRIQAVEQYLLGCLSPIERNAFEEHYFDCAICADEIAGGTMFMDNAAAEIQTMPRETRKVVLDAKPARLSWWRAPAFGMATFGALAVAGGWIADHRNLSSELASATAPQSFTIAQIEGARGADDGIKVERSGRYFALEFFPNDSILSKVYRVEISGDGVAPVSLTATAPGTGKPVSILLPVAQFKPGKYRMTVAPENGAGSQTVVFQLL